MTTTPTIKPTPPGHDPSADCWCDPHFWPDGPYAIGMTHRDVDPATLDRNWVGITWYREGTLDCVCCADPDCFEPAAVVQTSPRVHTAAQLAAIKRTVERDMRRDPLARYCPLHRNNRDQSRPWHRVRVHLPAAGVHGETTFPESIRGRDQHEALYFAGWNWPDADAIAYLGPDAG